MTCWKCEKPIEGQQPRCPACEAIQPLPRGSDHFSVMGLPRQLELGLPELEQRFRDLSWQVHPDRFAKASGKERRIALERSTALNDAYRTLKDPLRRASYLLKLNGLAVESESGASAMANLPSDFLEEVMELREGLFEAKAGEDSDGVAELLAGVRDSRGRAVAEVEKQLEKLPAQPDPARIAAAGAALARIRYYDRFIEEAEGNHED